MPIVYRQYTLCENSIGNVYIATVFVLWLLFLSTSPTMRHILRDTFKEIVNQMLDNEILDV